MSSSDSDGSQTQVQESQDNRIAAAEGSVNLVASRSNIGNVNLTSTDFGSVSKAFDFAAMLAKGAASESAASQAAVAASATSAVQSVQSAYKDVNENLAAAWEGAKAGEQKMMVVAGLAVVGIVAFKAMGKSA